MIDESLNELEDNYLRTNKFELVFHKFENVSYKVTALNIPGISNGIAEYPTMFFQAKLPGDSITYDDFEISFLIDKKLKNYLLLYHWLKGIGFPESFDQFKEIYDFFGNFDISEPFSDCSIIINDSDYKPIITCELTNVFPVTLSGIQFSHKSTEFMNGIQATATFKFNELKFQYPASTKVII
nr:MAG TPA: baseplate wedge protein [Caudoviricetes sp.]